VMLTPVPGNVCPAAKVGVKGILCFGILRSEMFISLP
jgi:hypothetical protein